MTSNPMSEASKAGLLKRMHADKADTFAKKVKWVSKHIPTITDPQAYVGWLTREERSKMATRNPNAVAHQRTAEKEMAAAEEAESMVKLSADHEEKAEFLLKMFQHAVLAEREADYAQHALGTKEGQKINFKGMQKTELEARKLAGEAYKKIRHALEAGLDKAKNPGVGGTRASAEEMRARKAEMRAYKLELAAQKKAKAKAKNPKRTSDHNYVVCDKNGKAVALTTTLAEARKIAPKGGCVEKL